MWVAGEREGYRVVRNVRTSLPIDVPEANVEPFIAISSPPAGAAPVGAGVMYLRDATGCQGLDPEP